MIGDEGDRMRIVGISANMLAKSAAQQAAKQKKLSDDYWDSMQMDIFEMAKRDVESDQYTSCLLYTSRCV